MTDSNFVANPAGQNAPDDLAAEQPDLTWRVLGTLNIFRIFLAAGWLILFFAGGADLLFGESPPRVFATTAAIYLCCAIGAYYLISRRLFTPGAQAAAYVSIDILAVVLLMHASGGIASGLGGLLVIFVGGGSLVLPLRFPLFTAAVASIAVLAEQLLSQFSGETTSASFTAAGVLGVIIFGIALAARPLGRRIQASEALAIQRGVDLANLAELNEYIVQHLRESIIVLDADNRIRLINESAAGLLGSDKEVRGKPLGSVAPGLASFIGHWRRDPRKKHSPDFSLTSPDNNLRINAHVAPLGSSDAGKGPVLIFLEDASLINARIQQSKLASLGRLSASIAHEIRNPVGAMSHAGQLLAESENLDGHDKRLTEIIQSHADRVSHIIDNVLQLSRRDHGRAEVLTLKPWLEDFVSEFTRTQELFEGQLSIVEIDDEFSVRVDTSHLRQVLWNLCDNALKYASDQGGIQIELRTNRTQRGNRPYLEVLDHGRGVPADIADKIFEPFFTAQSGGTGLGLFISRELCELNGATLVFEPRPEGGSIFRIIFADPQRWESLDS